MVMNNIDNNEYYYIEGRRRKNNKKNNNKQVRIRAKQETSHQHQFYHIIPLYAIPLDLCVFNRFLLTWTGLTLAAPELQLGSVTMNAPNMEAAGPAFSALLSREAWSVIYDMVETWWYDACASFLMNFPHCHLSGKVSRHEILVIQLILKLCKALSAFCWFWSTCQYLSINFCSPVTSTPHCCC